jgi:hypothetical protein
MATALFTDGPTALTGTAVTVYTGAGTLGSIIRNIHVAAVGGVDTWFTLSIGTDAAGTRWAYQREVLANKEFDWSGFLFIPNGTIIQALARASSEAVLFISGTEET